MIQFVLVLMLLLPYSSIAIADDLEFKDFPKWQRVVSNEKYTPPEKEFTGDVKKLLSATLNRYSKLSYVQDVLNYGKEDYWTTREELLAKGSGDCEDFAIAEYYDLLEAGIKDSDMKIVVVYIKDDEYQIHTVLKVKSWYLDSRSKIIVTQHEFDKHYVRIYAVNRERVFK